MPSRESDQGQRIEVSGPAALGDAIAATHGFAIEQDLGERDHARLCIVVEELIANLCEHGICSAECEIGLELGRRGGALTVVVEDNGAPFDPRQGDRDAAVPDRGGGAGLRLVNSWAEIVGYESGGGHNRLELLLPLADH